MEKKRGLIWFRENLRMHDNAPLNQALEECDEVVLLYIYDKTLLQGKNWGIDRMGGHKLRFLYQTVEDLQSNLEEEDLYLLEVYDAPIPFLKKFVHSYQIQTIYSGEGLGTEEKKTESQIRKFCELKLYNTDRLFNQHELGFELKDLPAVFTNFRKKVEKNANIPSSKPFKRGKAISIELESTSFFHQIAPRIKNPHPKAAFSFTGGETVGLLHLKEYTWQKQFITTYKNTRNNLIGSSYSSKFSPWLANGSLSVRQVWNEITQFEKNVISNPSTYWLKFEILWREFFKWTLMENQEKLFLKNGVKLPKLIDSPMLTPAFYNWMKGNTSNEFINANINELNKTGFMSNRGRQIVASYLIYDLKTDWRLGAAFFEQQLIDYDPASNYGNWTYIAGVGNDPRGGRHFNVDKQVEQYDPHGQYKKLWTK